MPLIEASDYRAPLLFRQAHLNTIYPALWRRITSPVYQRETLELADGDFLDLDWSKKGETKQLIIALHGLEGAADRPYIRGMMRYFNERGWDAVGLNFRSCSGRPNRLLQSYHMGASYDLVAVVAHAIALGYTTIVPIGFSLGGNVTLKYMGEHGDTLPAEVKAAVAFSVPCHIATANKLIDRRHNRVYRQRFLQSLLIKMRVKASLFPDRLQVTEPLPRGFQDFDDQYTAPIHGFRDAADYWKSCSSLYFLSGIQRPTLLVNANDDTCLSEDCYPREIARAHPYLFLEIPAYGGHVGFTRFKEDASFWSEERAYRFIEEVVI